VLQTILESARQEAIVTHAAATPFPRRRAGLSREDDDTTWHDRLSPLDALVVRGLDDWVYAADAHDVASRTGLTGDPLRQLAMGVVIEVVLRGKQFMVVRAKRRRPVAIRVSGLYLNDIGELAKEGLTIIYHVVLTSSPRPYLARVRRER
jgi:hypothetical protein